MSFNGHICVIWWKMQGFIYLLVRTTFSRNCNCLVAIMLWADHCKIEYVLRVHVLLKAFPEVLQHLHILKCFGYPLTDVKIVFRIVWHLGSTSVCRISSRSFVQPWWLIGTQLKVLQARYNPVTGLKAHSQNMGGTIVIDAQLQVITLLTVMGRLKGG